MFDAHLYLTIIRQYAAIIKHTFAAPVQLGTKVRSVTHSAFGRAGDERSILQVRVAGGLLLGAGRADLLLGVAASSIRPFRHRAGSVLQRVQVELLVGTAATDKAGRGIERIDEHDPSDPFGVTLGTGPSQLPTERVGVEDDLEVGCVIGDGVEFERCRARLGAMEGAVCGTGPVVPTPAGALSPTRPARRASDATTPDRR